MTGLHLNTGRWLAQPHESGYARIRRCLAANPGLSFAAISKALGQAMPDTWRISTAHRLEILEATETPRVLPKRLRQNAYRRQCPSCARQLYHADISALPWMQACPIHHEPLTSGCPDCGLPWPHFRDIGRRDCACCGRVTWERATEYVLPQIRQTDYDPIADILSLAHADESAPRIFPVTHGYAAACQSAWWRPALVTTTLHPNLAAHRAKRTLRQLNVEPMAVEVISAPLHRVGAEKAGLSFSVKQELQLEVMQHINAHIQRTTGNKHMLCVSDYERVDQRYLADGPCPCPYCMALSMWVCGTVSATDYRYIALPSNYPICREGGVESFLPTSTPLVEQDGEYWEPAEKLVRWFYRRGLLLRFAQMLQFVLDTLASLAKQNDRWGDQRDIDQQVFKASDVFIRSKVGDRRLLIAYDAEDPLARLQAQSVETTQQRCRDYRRYWRRTGGNKVRDHHRMLPIHGFLSSYEAKYGPPPQVDIPWSKEHEQLFGVFHFVAAACEACADKDTGKPYPMGRMIRELYGPD